MRKFETKNGRELAKYHEREAKINCKLAKKQEDEAKKARSFRSVRSERPRKVFNCQEA